MRLLLVLPFLPTLMFGMGWDCRATDASGWKVIIRHSTTITDQVAVLILIQDSQTVMVARKNEVSLQKLESGVTYTAHYDLLKAKLCIHGRIGHNTIGELILEDSEEETQTVANMKCVWK